MCQGSELITLTYCPILLRAEGHGFFLFVCFLIHGVKGCVIGVMPKRKIKY